ncbi:hypothetical protein M9Y10_028760 [Tritrichomonas musculus]|uniref:Uncharacterized protein n=1 Tax=Tritrichomonas musculus TaxID=1915356 RepID=A0ABR2KK82_9EUKA
MESKEDSSLFCFCVFHHQPFQRGIEGVEEASIIDQLIYKYPSSLSDRSVEDFISAIISLYTYTTLTLQERNLDFLAWSKSKVAIRTIKNQEDKSILFFVLRLPEQYSNSSIIKTIDYLKNGIFFAIGPEKILLIPELKAYLTKHGNKICSIFNSLSNLNPIPFSFINMSNCEWHRSSIASVLTQVHIMQNFPDIWGISCFVDNLLLVSHTDIDIIRHFNFVEDSKKVTVYLTKSDRSKLIDYPRSIAEIPELEMIESLLLKFQFKNVVFYLLSNPKITEETLKNVEQILNQIISEVSVVFHDETKLHYPKNTLFYNRLLEMLRCSGKTTKEFQKNCVFAHDMFNRHSELKDIVLKNSIEFFVGMNIVNLENFSSINENPKLSLIDMFDETIKANPELFRLLQSFNLQ